MELPRNSRILLYGAANVSASVKLVSRLVNRNNQVIVFAGAKEAESSSEFKFPGSVVAMEPSDGSSRIDIREFLSLIEQAGSIDEVIMMLDLPVSLDHDPDDFISIIETAVKVGSLEYLVFLYLVLPYLRRNARCSLVMNCFDTACLSPTPFSYSVGNMERESLVHATANMIRKKHIRLQGVSSVESASKQTAVSLDWKDLGQYVLGFSGLMPAKTSEFQVA